jgi:hypothetical protein
MGIIQCAENCRHQADGYCTLDKYSNVTSLENSCPYFVSRLFDNGNRLCQVPDPYKLD